MSCTYNDFFGSSQFGGMYGKQEKKANTYRHKGLDEVADWVVSSIFASEKHSGYSIPECCGKTTSNTTVYIKTAVASVKDMVEKIQTTFGLNLSQIAKIIGVSRATIYNHINDDNSVAEHYVDFYRLSLEVELQYGCVAAVLKNILVNDRTLLRHLECSYKDADLIMSVIEQIKGYKPQKSANFGTISDQKRANMLYVVSK